MKKILAILCAMAVLLCGCGGSKTEADSAAEGYPENLDEVYLQAPEDGLSEGERAEFLSLLEEELLKRGQVKLEFVNDESECSDPNKLYVFPDNMIYEYKKVLVNHGVPYTNALTLAVDQAGEPFTGENGEVGYKAGHRLTSKNQEKEEGGMCCTGFIPVSNGDVIRIRNVNINSPVGGYVFLYGQDRETVTKRYYLEEALADPADGVYTFAVSVEGTAYIRISTGMMDETTVLTVNEEIVDEEIVTEEFRWVSTGHSFVTSDYEERILALEEQAKENAEDISGLKGAVGGTSAGDAEGLAWIRNWDAPIYDNAPVVLLDEEKPAVTEADKSIDAVYAKYDALMAAHPDFITRTDLGLCSDGINHVYRYDFRESEPHHQRAMEWSETKAKIIVVSGIHEEWGGIYSLYHAMEEIASNPELSELRRNLHFIVLPLSNPYALTEESDDVRNANGVEIHRNFEVAHAVTEAGTRHYGGEKPLSEVESQYLDRIFAENADAAYFLSCHSNQHDTVWGTGFIWASAGTKYMCNMGFRLVDKMSRAWHQKYGAEFEEGVARENAAVLADPENFPEAKALAEGDFRVGFAHVSSTPGTETRQATKYGIQAVNVEACDTFWVLDTVPLSGKAMTHGAETYINFFLTAMNCYDHQDKILYQP